MSDPKLVLSADEVEFSTTHNPECTEISVHIKSGSKLTRDEFVAALQLFIDEMLGNEEDFLAGDNDVGDGVH